jgi:hypothetical protein
MIHFAELLENTLSSKPFKKIIHEAKEPALALPGKTFLI